MKIESIHLKEFKRFKDLIISGLPETAKLVVLIGPNGCGKSSLFDAIETGAKTPYYGVSPDFLQYYNRDGTADVGIRQRVNIQFHTNPTDKKKAVYIRPAYRHESSFAFSGLSKTENIENRIRRMIDEHKTTSKNYMHLVSNALEDAFEHRDANSTMGEFRESVIGEIRDSLQKMFPELVLNSIGNPLRKNATFQFDKKAVRGFSYENLSGGEKAAFDMILDLVVKVGEFDDTIFGIDEPESHVAMKMHGELLSVLYDLVPDNCQLWIATHSIGMMREAYELYRKSPASVVFLDFDEDDSGKKMDFDKPQTITPKRMTRALWERMHDVILGDLAKLVMPDTIYLCESHPHKSFDADCYNHIFATEYPTVKFISLGGKGQLTLMRHLLSTAAPDLQLISLRDGDRSTPSRKQKDSTTNSKVLSRRCIEEYLVDNEVTSLLCKQQQWQTAQEDMNKIAVIREEYIGKPKETAEKILQYLNDTHPEHALGDDTDDFLRNTLAQLIKPGMSVYEELKRDIFGNGAEQ